MGEVNRGGEEGGKCVFVPDVSNLFWYLGTLCLRYKRGSLSIYTITEDMKIKNKDISYALGGLLPQKLTCSIFAENLLKSAFKEEK